MFSTCRIWKCCGIILLPCSVFNLQTVSTMDKREGKHWVLWTGSHRLPGIFGELAGPPLKSLVLPWRPLFGLFINTSFTLSLLVCLYRQLLPNTQIGAFTSLLHNISLKTAAYFQQFSTLTLLPLCPPSWTTALVTHSSYPRKKLGQK